MNKRQQWIIAVVILLPLAVGGLLSIGKTMHSGSFLHSSFAKKIGVVRITDVIYESENVIAKLKAYREDDAVGGVVVRVNSPGGAVAPSQEIYAEIMRFREENKPVVVSMENVAASGGYYVSASAMRIFADPGTLTGSLGVIMQFPQYYKLLEKVGVHMVTIKAGKFKDIGSPNRAMTTDETVYIEALLHDTHLQFIEDVARGRSLPEDSVKGLADGRIFTGRQAVALGLVDTLGGFADAISYLKEYIGLPKDARVDEEKDKVPLWKSLVTQGRFHHGSFLAKMFRPSGFYYLCDIL